VVSIPVFSAENGISPAYSDAFLIPLPEEVDAAGQTVIQSLLGNDFPERIIHIVIPLNRAFAARGAVLFAAVLAAGCTPAPSTSTSAPDAAAPSSGEKRLNIAVIPKGTTHEFWKSVHAGAENAAREMDVDITWKGPLKENDRADQISIVDQFVSSNVSAIALAPLDDTALVKPVRSAVDKKIPVIIFDSALKGEAGKDYTSLVATNNYKGGMIGGEALVKLLGGKGKVVLLRYQEGSASTQERENGFTDVIKKNPGITLIVDNRYSGPTVSDAKTASMQMIDKLKEADGIFCPNESSTFGMLLALRQNNLAGKVKFVGFDTSPSLLDGMKKGEIDALVAQNPTKMGYEAVKAAVSQLKGETVPPSVDTGVTLIDSTNIDSTEVKTLLGGA
jgi:ribose transport system substrate-binding protein